MAYSILTTQLNNDSVHCALYSVKSECFLESKKIWLGKTTPFAQISLFYYFELVKTNSSRKEGLPSFRVLLN